VGVTNVNRRVSLPGVDELFGTSSTAGGRDQPSGSSPSVPDDAADAEVAEALAAVRRLAAVEDGAMQTARKVASDLAVPSPEVGALLRWAVTAAGARTVVEIGSAGGLSGLWILTALPVGGVLTSLEPDPDGHALAKRAFDGSHAGPRVRAIQGDPGTLLSRLADGSYDLVVLQAEPGAYPEHLQRARALLRPGGMLLARGVLPAGEHAEALTRFLHDLVEDPGFSATVLPLDDGIALASRLAEPEDT
jgi:predicted O-methyltransferase YrrM